MSQVNEALEGLIQAIWEGEEYQRYQKIRAKVHEIPELEQRINAFRKKNYEVQNRTDECKLYDQVDGLEREGIEFRKDPLVNEYLSAELGICRLFQRINWELVRNIDFDLGFAIDH
ncbi:MAG: YlbF family regulator [Eubacterium sp.]|nr:YlbF family regulator [Eubacterium sp.]